MPKIAFIGAGSVEFSQKLLVDLLTFPELRGSTIALHDIDQRRLDTAAAVARRTCAALGVPPNVEAALERRASLDGADYVFNMIQVGGHPATLLDFEIPARYGVRQTIADTLGIGGIFRALRTIPVTLDIASDMAELCPQAWLLNYTNPMAMLCWAVYEGSPIQRVVGLCHSVQQTHRLLSQHLGLPPEEVDFLCAGVNHQAFMLGLEREGLDLYPELDELFERDPELRRTVRVDMYRNFGYFPTESSEHSAEYVPWYMNHDDLLERFRIPVNEYVRRSERNLSRYEEIAQRMLEGDIDVRTERSLEYGALIIDSMETGEERLIYGNVRNDGLIDNLPQAACVEVACTISKDALRPHPVGPLPPQLAALNRTYLNVVELTVRAALEGDPWLVRQAAMLDPNTAATLGLEQICALCDDLVAAHGDALPEPLRAIRPKPGRLAGLPLM